MDYVKYYEYSLSSPPLFPKRNGIIFAWDDGRWSEASPLQGWSEETLSQVKNHVRSKDFPSLDFAYDARPFSPISVPVCALLAGTREKIEKDALKLEACGMPLAKLKLSLFSLDEAIEITKELRTKFRLRLDFNRSLELAEALRFAEYFNDIEFYEEPLRHPQELAHFPHPIALDESLREKKHHSLALLPHVKALVIKPTMTGSLAACSRWTSLGKEIVFSSSFESGIGILQIMLLAKALNIPVAPLGLDTYRFLREDLLEEPIHFSKGYAHAPTKLSIKHSLLTEHFSMR